MIKNTNTYLFLLFAIFFFMLNSQQALSLSLTRPQTNPTNDEIKKAFQSLYEKSEIVVHGLVADTHSSYFSESPLFPNQDQIIVSDFRITIKEAFKGNPKNNEILFTVPGGCIEEEDRCFYTNIFPKIYNDDEVILFLNKNEKGQWILSNPLIGFQRRHLHIFYPSKLTLNDFQEQKR